ncbi:Bug family tripartite tricarboxylate transporter substrate binding protein [Bordetella genomosp. 13]|uniref:Bug family tripartite tricarboxylate transporter substrate binding protein n=1 Tax=Bordetella genomosp. 13 TaxID=463040 RepID=UPI001642851F|nr:tripartite tricarboxylate transporter substrate binding protein [Bordetella genomosp. 13]
MKLAGMLAMMAAAAQAGAAGYPERPIRLVVPFPPGGTADIVARVVSDRVAQELKTTVIVENKPGGAGGSVGTLDIVRAKPDGYTFGIATVGTLGTAPATAPKPLYDPERDFSYVTNIAGMPMLLVAGPSMGTRSFDDILARVRAEPDRISFGSGGTGGVAHLMGAKFQVATKTRLIHVPYRGANPALNDLAGGQVDLVFDALASSTPFLQGDRVRAIAISGDTRLKSLPETPTFKELGLQPVSTDAWYGLVGPAGIDAAIVERVHLAVKSALASDAVRERLDKIQTQAIGSDPAAYRKQVLDELQAWRDLAKSQNIVVD